MESKPVQRRGRKPATSGGASGRVKAVVACDMYGHRVNGLVVPVSKGATVEVTQAEFTHGEACGALVKP